MVQDTRGEISQKNDFTVHKEYKFSMVLKAVLGQYELFTNRNIRDHLAWTIGNGDVMYGMCIPHRIPRA